MDIIFHSLNGTKFHCQLSIPYKYLNDDNLLIVRVFISAYMKLVVRDEAKVWLRLQLGHGVSGQRGLRLVVYGEQGAKPVDGTTGVGLAQCLIYLLTKLKKN